MRFEKGHDTRTKSVAFNVPNFYEFAPIARERFVDLGRPLVWDPPRCGFLICDGRWYATCVLFLSDCHGGALVKGRPVFTVFAYLLPLSSSHLGKPMRVFVEILRGEC